MENEVIEFLKKNGFKADPDYFEDKLFYNDLCEVNIYEDCYRVHSNIFRGSMYSTNLEIYWLIGVLTYYKLMNRNYE